MKYRSGRAVAPAGDALAARLEVDLLVLLRGDGGDVARLARHDLPLGVQELYGEPERLGGNGLEVGGEERDGGAARVGDEARHGHLHGQERVGLGEVFERRVAFPAEIPRRRQQLDRGAVERVELHEPLRHVEQPRRVAQLVVPYPERIQGIPTVGVLRERDGEGPGSRPEQALAHESLTGGEQLFRIEALPVGGDGVEYLSRFVPAATSLATL